MDEIDEGLNNSSEGMDTMATAAAEVAQVPDEFREQAEQMLGTLRQRIAEAMKRLAIGHENPRLIEAHIRFAVQFDATMPRLEQLKMLELERLVFDANEELTYRPELIRLYSDRADNLYNIPAFAYTDTVLADGPSIADLVARKRAVSA